MPFDGGSFYGRVQPATIADEFLAWVRAKPKRGFYNYLSVTNCAFMRFLKDTNRVFPWSSSDGQTWTDKYGRIHMIPYAVAQAIVSPTMFSTYGSLARRLEKNLL